MGSYQVYSCLLCGGLLPQDDPDVPADHLAGHHRVFTRNQFILVASMLGEEQLEMTLTFMSKFLDGGIKEKVSNSIWETMIDMNKVNTEDKEENSEVCDNEQKASNLIFDGKHSDCFVQSVEEMKTESIIENRNVLIDKKKRGRPVGIKNEKKDILEVKEGRCICPICKKMFDIVEQIQETEYRDHVLGHRVKRFDCDCDIKWENEKRKKVHIYKAHRGLFHCDICNKSFQYEEGLKDHRENKHKDRAIFMCDACDFTTENKYKLTSHITYNHDENIRVCDICCKKLKGNRQLNLHKKSSHKDKTPCPHCGKIIKKMQRHIKTAHVEDSEKKYKCTHCKKGFIDNNKLESHVRSIHVKDKPFVCRFMCGVACNDKGNRKKHEIARHGVYSDINLH